MKPSKHHRDFRAEHPELLCYYGEPLLYRVKTDRWHRSWQAEFDIPQWKFCPRAYTRAGARRKAFRWMKRAIDERRHRELWYRYLEADDE